MENKTMAEEVQRLFDYVVEVASGAKVCSEAAGFHDMAIFKQGVHCRSQIKKYESMHQGCLGDSSDAFTYCSQNV